MSIRRRQWTRKDGSIGTGLACDYYSGDGKRCHATFRTRKAAKEYMATAQVEIKAGTHTPRSRSATIAEAAARWIEQAEVDQLERATVRTYRAIVEHHITPFLGATRLADLTSPAIVAYEAALLRGGRSPGMIKRVTGALSMILGCAQRGAWWRRTSWPRAGAGSGARPMPGTRSSSRRARASRPCRTCSG
jgi:integrase